MLRRFRFGFLSLFAAMLLVVSAAGWWKFHRDLYVEEQAVLAELAKANCDYLAWYELHEAGAPSGAAVKPFEPAEWQKLFTRIRVLNVDGDVPEALRQRMAALPGLQILIIEPHLTDSFGFGAPPAPSLKPLPPVEKILNGSVPAFADPTIEDTDLESPLAEGEPLSEAETRRTIAAIREALSRVPEPPPRYVRLVESEALRPQQQRQRMLFGIARDGESFLSFENTGSDELFSNPVRSGDGSTSYSLGRTPRGLTLAYRVVDSVSDDAKPGVPPDEFLQPPILVHPGLLPEDLSHVASMERLDERRVRLNFESFEEAREQTPDFSWTESVLQYQAVVREDLGWAVESMRKRSKHASAVGDSAPPAQIAQEYRYVRLDDRVLPVETLTGWGVDDGSDNARFRMRYAWSLDPEFADGTFDVNRLLDEPLPPPRDLPLWRWYYGTLALGVALALFILGRNVIGLFRSRRLAAVAVERG